jgi:hypothetical protein
VQVRRSFSDSGVTKLSGLVFRTGDVFAQQSSNLRSSSVPRGAARSDASAAGTRDSWARSSRSSNRSSVGGRYDDSETTDRDDSFVAKEAIVQQKTADMSSNAVLKGTGKPIAVQPAPQGRPTEAPAMPSGASRVEEDLPDGGKLIRYKNGTEKRTDKAGNSTVRFLNGDTKSSNLTSGAVVYYYAEAKTTHTTYSDGVEVYEFPNGQVRPLRRCGARLLSCSRSLCQVNC